MRGKNFFPFFVISVIAALILPDLFREGMFMDGTLYSSVALNFSRGLGSFWHPHFAKISMPFFHEQPPLMFAMLGSFFRVCGESFLVERFYALAMFIISAGIFLQIVKVLLKGTDAQAPWFALFLWVCIPVAPWIVNNNMEENTMGVFVLLSVLFLLKSFGGAKNYWPLYTFAAALSVVCAFLTKGFPGIFPIVLPAVYFLFYKDAFPVRRLVFVQFGLLVFIAAITFFLFSWTPSKICLSTWLNERVVNSIKNVSNSNSRFEIIWILIQQLIPVLVMGLALVFFVKSKKIPVGERQVSWKKNAMVVLILALCGSIPLMVTREQRTFYLGVALPVFAISAALFLMPFYKALKNANWKPSFLNGMRFLPPLIFITAVCYLFILIGTPKRDVEKLHDIKIFAGKIARGEIIRIPESMWNDWELQTNLIRTNYISLSYTEKNARYLLADPPEFAAADTAGYRRLNWGTVNYVVYEKVSP
jgi:hypothetical protein